MLCTDLKILPVALWVLLANYFSEIKLSRPHRSIGTVIVIV